MSDDVRHFLLRCPDGRTVDAYEIQEWIVSMGIDGKEQRHRGLRRYELRGGGALNASSDGKTFTVVATGEVLAVA